ncbi:hypothetical protein [Maritimibacter sp. DP1N21-5]|uniref:hypothetical protein n=1 Tax=Maritimibacter sp. DP1N21-5 TaxID=2836867 RepID=UPI001C47561C|nr:hypothetical protein [Maritimibacter sp. DP1N21-5]MBV7409400.1 hypothetical protein [Maritimibacter sp. DP1N21-5]
MSAPHTNIERQQRRHFPALAGIALAVLVGGIMGAAMTYTAIDRADAPEATGVSDATGQPVVE